MIIINFIDFTNQCPECKSISIEKTGSRLRGGWYSRSFTCKHCLCKFMVREKIVDRGNQ